MRAIIQVLWSKWVLHILVILAIALLLHYLFYVLSAMSQEDGTYVKLLFMNWITFKNTYKATKNKNRWAWGYTEDVINDTYESIYYHIVYRGINNTFLIILDPISYRIFKFKRKKRNKVNYYEEFLQDIQRG